MNNKQESIITKHIISYEETDSVTRILRFEHLMSMISTGILKVPRVASWDDTHENFLFKSTMKVGERQFGNIFENFKYHERFFGLCWSYWNETDALWRIYSPNQDRIKIKVNVGKLWEAFVSHYQAQPDGRVIPSFGRIVYISKEDWSVAFSHEFLVDVENFLTHNVMYIKRMEFEYENEFRTIFVCLDANKGGDFIDIPIEPHELIEEIVFDPRISDELMKNYSNQLVAHGFDNFSKSSLYSAVNHEINHDGSSINIPPLKVINYFDRNNALRLCSDSVFEELAKSTVSQIKEKMENK